MASSNRAAVLVVGAGPTGLVMAAELARRGVHCRIIDQAPMPSQFSKALGIQARTLEVFQNMGLADEFTAVGHRARAANLYAEGRRIGRLSFDEIESPYPFLLILPQSDTERILGRHLASHGIDVQRQTVLTGLVQDSGGVTATLRRPDGRSEEVRSDWLIGCDGAHSAVRHALGLPFEGAAYAEQFLLADAPVDWSAAMDELHVSLTAQGLLAMFPLGGGRWRMIADNPPASVPGAEPTRDQCQALADARGPGEMTLGPLEWSSNFRISRRLVSHLRMGQVFLAGDAAHIHSPAGGQGMNTGIQDAVNLAWKLALVTRGEADPNLLDSYHEERHPVAQAVLRATDLVTRVATAQNPVLRSLRGVLAPLLTALPPVQARLRDGVSQVAVHYRGSPAVAEDTHSIQFRTGPMPGDRAPDARLLSRTGEPVSLFELLRFPAHTLLLLGARSEHDAAKFAEIAGAIQSLFADLVAVHLIAPDRAGPRELVWDGSRLLDPGGAFHHRYAASSPSLYLVRPDGYIGYRAAPPDAGRLIHYLTQTLTLRPNVDKRQPAHP